MERSQKKIHRKDELTWPAHILTCSPHVLSHVLELNGTSLLAVTCPCKNQTGWPFWCPYRNVVFFGLERFTGRRTLKSHGSNAIIHALKPFHWHDTQRQQRKFLSAHDHRVRQLMTLAVFSGKKQTTLGIILWPQNTDYHLLIWLLNFKIPTCKCGSHSQSVTHFHCRLLR